MGNDDKQRQIQVVRTHLERQQQILQQQWQDAIELLRRMGQEQVIETDVADRFKLEKQTTRLNADKTRLEEELRQLERDLADLDDPARVDGCLQKYRPLLSPSAAVPAGTGSTEILDYCRKAAALHEKIPLMGFKTALRVPIRIEDIYVPLRAMIDDRPTGKSCFADAEDAEKMVPDGRGGCEISIPDAFLAAEQRHRRGIVMLGDPGSGKTTHLKRVLLWCLRGGLDALGLPQEMIPVFLPLRDLTDVTQNLDDFIQEQLRQPHLGTPAGFGQRLLARGNLLLLCDGLDEVADTVHRTKVARWIETALRIHHSCRFVITCRFAGYTAAARLDADFLEMHLRPLTTAQAEAFVRNWYQIVETAQAGDRAQAAIIANAKADDLIQRLRQPDFRARRVFELTRNPLLLTNICLVHLDRGNLPHTRAALYDECTDVLLERWGAVGIRTRLTAQTGRKVLQPIAYWLHQQEARTRATAAELTPVIAPVLKTIGWSAQALLARSKQSFDTPEDEALGAAREFLQTVRDESGLLTRWDQDHYGFMHLGFQEYLTAVEIRNRAYDDPAIWQELAVKFGDPWWQEVILLLLALYNPSVFKPFMRAVLKRPEVAGQRHLLEMCLDDAAEKSAQPFLELLESAAGQDQDLWRRQFLALQLVARLEPQMAAQLTPALRKHPSPQIRQWLREQARQARQKVISAEKGGYELVFVPGGVFLMGSPETEKGRYEDESPLHEVQIADFYMGRYPVTNAEYGRFLAENPAMPEPEYWGNRDYNQPNQPVVGVSWHDAQAFAAWLNEQHPPSPLKGGRPAQSPLEGGRPAQSPLEGGRPAQSPLEGGHPAQSPLEGGHPAQSPLEGGHPAQSPLEGGHPAQSPLEGGHPAQSPLEGGRGVFRLPSEAEWEYACRAGTTTRYYTGDTEADLERAGWYDENSAGKLHPVGEKEPNDFGLYDMHGNVFEWCQDWYNETYYAKSPKENPPGPTAGSYRVVRGGSWYYDAGNCRAAGRNSDAPDNRYRDVGFRLVRTPG